MDVKNVAKDIVNAITQDIGKRSGFGPAYRIINPTIRTDMLRVWEGKIVEIISQNMPAEAPKTTSEEKKGEKSE